MKLKPEINKEDEIIEACLELQNALLEQEKVIKAVELLRAKLPRVNRAVSEARQRVNDLRFIAYVNDVDFIK